MTNEPTSNLNTFHLMMKIDEATDEAYFLCPFSGHNVVLWEDDLSSVPSELVFCYVNMADEMQFIKDEYLAIFDEDDFEDNDVDVDLLEAYLAKLPADRQFSCLIVGHPDQVHGDFVAYVYEGVVSEDFVRAWT